MLHENSQQAHAQGVETGRFNERAQLVLDILRANGPCTDREVMLKAGFVEPNAVRPRISEMVKQGVLFEVGAKLCPVTFKTVRIVFNQQPTEQS